MIAEQENPVYAVSINEYTVLKNDNKFKIVKYYLIYNTYIVYT